METRALQRSPHDAPSPGVFRTTANNHLDSELIPASVAKGRRGRSERSGLDLALSPITALKVATERACPLTLGACLLTRCVRSQRIEFHRLGEVTRRLIHAPQACPLTISAGGETRGTPVRREISGWPRSTHANQLVRFVRMSSVAARAPRTMSGGLLVISTEYFPVYPLPSTRRTSSPTS